MAKAPTIPQVILCRDRNEGEDATQASAVTEAYYVIEMIQEGGSNYSDDPDNGKAALRSCKQYLKRCGANGKMKWVMPRYLQSEVVGC